MSPALSVGAEAFDATLATNIRAPYFLTAALAPGMIAKGSAASSTSPLWLPVP